MLPPIAPSILERNPRFKALYHDLSTSRLNPDATTRLIKQQRAQAEVEKQLQALRKESAQASLLRSALERVASRSSELPTELRELCQIAAANASGHLLPDDLSLLDDDLDVFAAHLEPIARAISSELPSATTLLSTLLSATSTSPLASSTSTTTAITAAAATLQSTITTQTASISTTRLRIAYLSDQLHSVHRELLESGVRVLEQTLHGAVARAARAKAEHLAAVAKGLELKARILDAADPMLPAKGQDRGEALQRGIKAYEAHLRAVEKGLQTREQEAKKALEEYEASTGMREIAERYAKVLDRCEEVRAEIRRLEQAQEKG